MPLIAPWPACRARRHTCLLTLHLSLLLILPYPLSSTPSLPPAWQHPRAAELFERDLAPFLSQSALRFWRPRLRYFADGLYYHGGMVGREGVG